ncbi:MAG TPA: hypothetical protein VJ903_02585, partial [Clostridia bacterium]|nr:hypothetical protein [Clostridia bacterium]
GLNKQQLQEFLYNAFSRPKTFPKLNNKVPQTKILDDKSIEFECEGEFYDHIEMSGTYASAIVSYGIDKKNKMRTFRHITFPKFRLRPDMTTSSLCHNFEKSAEILVDGVEVKEETLEKAKIKGNLELTSNFKKGLRIVRTEIISQDYPALIEKVTITNITQNKINLTILDNVKSRKYSQKLCKIGNVKMVSAICGEHGRFSLDKEKMLEKSLFPNANYTYYNIFIAIVKDETIEFAVDQQIRKRENLINNAMMFTTLKTPDNYANALYSHSILRGTESVFETQKGLLHSPGGGRYYAAIWANDQLEYAAPIAPFLGNKELIEATKNAINLYVNYIDTSGVPFVSKRSLPSSIINGSHPFGIAGDRGDTAMVGLGIVLFCLNNNDIPFAKEYLWAVEWCIEFCESRKTESGVIASDSDELEGRFPSGKCNLSTNINYYLLLENAIILEKELGNFAKSDRYDQHKTQLKKDICQYFEAEVEGYDTYRYYENNKDLRSWICLPLIAGIFNKKKGTIQALTQRLYKDGKMLTSSKRDTVWDRSLLFSLRAMFISGEVDLSMKYLSNYSKARLLGAHSPYPYEAYPEGNGAQLSAESLLYVRIIVEGMFGIKAIGFNKFAIEPKLPFEGNYKLCNVYLGAKLASIEVEKGKITVVCGNETYQGVARLEILI